LKKWFYKHFLNKKYQTELDPLKIKKVLILRYDRLGDMVVTLPLIKSLKEAYPNYQIDILASDLNQSIVRDNPYVNNIYIYNFREKRSLFQFFKVFKKLREERYDLVIDPFYSNISRAASHLKFIDAKFNIGLAKRERYGLKSKDFKLFYDYVPFNQKEHLSDNILNISTLLGLNKEDFLREDVLDYVHSYEKGALTFLKSYQNKKVILFNIQGSSQVRSFNDNFIMSFSKELISESHIQVIIVAMPNRKEKLQTLVNKENNSRIVLANTKSILDAVALIKHVPIVISPDTSIVHIASCFQKKIITFYKDNLMNKIIFAPYTKNYKMFIYDDLYQLTSNDAKTIFSTILKERHLV